MAESSSDLSDFYVRYQYYKILILHNYVIISVGHKGKYGHEFLEFEFRPDGRLRYANNSNYKSDILIRKEGYLFYILRAKESE